MKKELDGSACMWSCLSIETEPGKDFHMTNEGWAGYNAEANAEAAPTETPQAFAARRDNEIMEWRGLKEQATFYVEQERLARAKVASTLFPNAHKGTQRYELGAGYKVKLQYGFTYTLGDKDLVDPATNAKVPIASQVEGIEDAIAALGNEGPMLADRLIRWKPELVESEYLKLNPEFEIEKQVKALIDSILTVKPKSPVLELEEPKPAK
jgi:hypothetical protein